MAAYGQPEKWLVGDLTDTTIFCGETFYTTAVNITKGMVLALANPQDASGKLVVRATSATTTPIVGIAGNQRFLTSTNLPVGELLGWTKGHVAVTTSVAVTTEDKAFIDANGLFTNVAANNLYVGIFKSVAAANTMVSVAFDANALNMNAPVAPAAP
jgi:hypothetical protein